MNVIPSVLKRSVTAFLDKFLVKGNWPLDVKAQVLEALPLSYWRKAVMYQQCLADQMIKRDGAVVQNGPFAGMKYIPDAIEGCLVPKLIGCYEEELWAV